MRNIRLEIEYDGTRYLGWQRQQGEDRTVQGKLEAVLSRLVEEPVQVIGASRTDAGVHALRQVANFHTSSGLDLTEMQAGLYRWLPEDIVVRSLEEVDERFHARYQARAKRYAYRVDNRPFHGVFQRRFSLHVPEPLDLPAMRAAAAFLTGKLDFSSFTSMKTRSKSTVRTLTAIEIRPDGPGGLLEIEFEADGFLSQMVRILTGTLLEVGTGRLPAERVPDILQARRRALAGPLVPARGLFLIEIFY